MDNKNYGILMSLALAGVAIGVWSEISSLWAVEQNWARLFSRAGTFTIGLYFLLLLLGLFVLLTSAWRIETLNNSARKLRLSLTARWLILTGLFLLYIYIYLFSIWQPILSQPWTQLLFAVGFAQIILFIMAPQREQRFGLRELALTLGIFVYPRLIQEMRALFADALVYRAATAAGIVILLGLVFALYSTYGENIRLLLIRWRERLGSVRFGIIALLCLTPLLHRYLVHWETYVLYDDIRFAIALLALWLVAYLALTGSNRLVSGETLSLSLGVLLCTSF